MLKPMCFLSNFVRSFGSILSTKLLRFCSSVLWSRQSLPMGQFPKALDEKHFVVPGEAYLCHDSRRSLTDLQETSQWLGGINVCKAMLDALTGATVFKKTCPPSLNWICILFGFEPQVTARTSMGVWLFIPLRTMPAWRLLP